MQPLPSISSARNHLAEKVDTAFIHIKAAAEAQSGNLVADVEVLKNLRAQIYEDLNQIQHRALILDAADYIDQKNETPLTWSWHPEQTGIASDPDLLGEYDGQPVVSAEASASARPIGNIDVHMSSTLKSLSQMPGKRYYFVRTEAMATHARTKTSKIPGADITVVIL